MPPPSNEQDLKRRARRRLIGAVALTLLAVIVLPLLLEDEPPPASSLAVKMAVAPPAPPAVPVEPAVLATPPQALPGDQTETPAGPEPGVAVTRTEPAKPAPIKPPAPKPEPAKPAPEKPLAKPSPPRPDAVKPTPHAEHKPAAQAAFVVQLAALADAGKARALATRASQTGLPAYIDTVGKLTRVRVGPFDTREAAVAAAVKLAERGLAGQVVAK